MAKSKPRAGLVILAFLALLGLRCTQSPTQLTDGSSSETVIGQLIGLDGAPAANTRVMLLPLDFDPVRDSLDARLVTMTDSTGRYCLRVAEKGYYALYAVDPLKGGRLISDALAVMGENPQLPTDTLRPTGSLSVTLPDSLRDAEVYAYVKGSAIFRFVSPASATLRIDSLPAGLLSELLYDRLGGTPAPAPLTDTLLIAPADTLSVEALCDWQVFSTTNSPLPRDTVYEIAFGADGAWWLGTLFGGVARVNEGVWSSWSSANSPLPDNTVYSIVTQGASVWLGTGKGVATYDGGGWHVYDTRNSPIGALPCYGLQIAPDGAMWVGTWRGIYRFDGFQWIRYSQAAGGLPQDSVYALRFDATGRLWVGMFGGGLASFDGATWTSYRAAEGSLPDDHVYTLALEQGSKVWVGTAGGVACLEGTAWTTYGAGQIVLALAVAADGTVWAGTTKGLLRIRQSEVTLVTQTYTGQALGVVWSLATDASGAVWAGTTAGLFRFGPLMR